jgi:hypothetical protein
LAVSVRSEGAISVIGTGFMSGSMVDSDSRGVTGIRDGGGMRLRTVSGRHHGPGQRNSRCRVSCICRIRVRIDLRFSIGAIAIPCAVAVGAIGVLAARGIPIDSIPSTGAGHTGR